MFKIIGFGGHFLSYVGNQMRNTQNSKSGRAFCSYFENSIGIYAMSAFRHAELESSTILPQS